MYCNMYLICGELVEGARAELRLRFLRVHREEGQPRRPGDPHCVPLVQLQGQLGSEIRYERGRVNIVKEK